MTKSKTDLEALVEIIYLIEKLKTLKKRFEKNQLSPLAFIETVLSVIESLLYA